VEAKRVLTLIAGLWALLLLYLASIQIPVAGVLVGSLIPLPIILVSRRIGWWSGFFLVLVAVGAILYLAHSFGLPGEILQFLPLALIGLLLAFWSGRGYPVDRTIGLTVLAVVLFGSGVFLGQALLQGLSPLDYLTRSVQAIVDNLLAFLRKEGIPLKELLPENFSASELVQFMVQISPALLVINVTLVVWLNMILARLIIGKTGREATDPPLNLWKSPEWLVFIALGGGFILFLPFGWLQAVGLNVLLVCGLIYFYQGLAIVAFIFQRCRVPRVIRFMGYPLVVIKPITFLIIGLGLVDLWFDFRRLHQPPSQA
jgi:uncharacterized protein YybS (DUF2232 family)